jgi:hypothetical protein
MCGTLYTNQQALAKAVQALSASNGQLDEQFAVLTRLMVVNINRISGTSVTKEDVTTLFEEWRAFKARSDFKEYNHTWFMGHDLSTLPPAPKKEETTGDQHGQDNDQNTKQAGQENTGPSQEDAVSQMRQSDTAAG